MNEQEFRELSAARALHALSPDEERVFSEALAAHPEWQTIADVDAETAAQIIDDEVAPPASIRASLLAALESTPQGVALGGSELRGAAEAPSDHGSTTPAEQERANSDEDPASPQKPARRRAAWFTLAACIAVLLALVIAFPVRSVLTPTDPVTLALEELDEAADTEVYSAEFDGAGQASVHWSEAEGQAVFVAEGLPEIEGDRDFQLWIVRGDVPISLGVISPDDDSGAAAIAPGFRDGDIVAVSVEQEGGSPTGAPTTDPILAVVSA